MNCSKNLIYLISSTVLAGCSGFHGYQSPAPVYGKPITDPYTQDPYPSSQESAARSIDETLTHPIKPAPDFKAINPIQTPSPQQIQSATMSPAVVALLSESERSSKAGHLDSAVVTLERALRIDPRNPMLTYKLAEIRIKQEKPRLAEDLAKKAALLAGRQNDIKRLSWMLISRARTMQGNLLGAREAKVKANGFK